MSLDQSLNVSMVMNRTVQELKQQNNELKEENAKIRQQMQQVLLQLKTYEQMANNYKDMENNLKKQEIISNNLNSQLLEKQKTLEQLEQKYKEALTQIQLDQQVQENAFLTNEKILDLQNQVSQLQGNELFQTKQTTKSVNNQNTLEIKVMWDPRLRNVQIQNRFDQDSLQLKGYAESEDQKVNFNQILKLQKRITGEPTAICIDSSILFVCKIQN